jgi:hypothetical protein
VRTTLKRRIRCDRVQEHRSDKKHRKRDPLPNASQPEPDHQHPAFDPKLRHRTWHTLISIKSFGDGEIEVRLEVSANSRIEWCVDASRCDNDRASTTRCPALLSFLSRHFPTTFGTAAACFDAALHVAKSFAVGCTLRADFGAFPAHMLVVRRTDQHEMSRCPADFAAGHHESEVIWLRMFATRFQTMAHRHRQAFPVARQAVIDAGFQFRRRVMH